MSGVPGNLGPQISPEKTDKVSDRTDDGCLAAKYPGHSTSPWRLADLLPIASLALRPQRITCGLLPPTPTATHTLGSCGLLWTDNHQG